MVGIRSFLAAILATLLAGAGLGVAMADPPAWAHGHGRTAEAAPGGRARALIVGTIAGIDYTTASVLVATPHGVVPVAITPSTSIYRGRSFASFADIGRGAHVEIDAAAIDGRLIAQLVRIH